MELQTPLSPCYDTVNKIDCPNRKVGCAASCARWKEYVVERDKVYKARYNENVINETYTRAHIAALKYAQRKREYSCLR